MSSVISKRVSGKTDYYYLATSARVDGKPRIVDQKYLGTAAEMEAAMDGATSVSSRTRHLAFGDLAATWAVIEKLGSSASSASSTRWLVAAGRMRAPRWAPISRSRP